MMRLPTACSTIWLEVLRWWCYTDQNTYSTPFEHHTSRWTSTPYATHPIISEVNSESYRPGIPACPTC